MMDSKQCLVNDANDKKNGMSMEKQFINSEL